MSRLYCSFADLGAAMAAKAGRSADAKSSTTTRLAAHTRTGVALEEAGRGPDAPGVCHSLSAGCCRCFLMRDADQSGRSNADCQLPIAKWGSEVKGLKSPRRQSGASAGNAARHRADRG